MSRRAVILLYLLLLILILYQFIFARDEYNSTLLLFTIIGFLIAVIIFLVRKENFPRIKAHYLRPSTLFLFSYLIVYSQCYVDLLVGNFSEIDSFFVNSSLINKASLLALGGLIAFFVGYISYRPIKGLSIARVDSLEGICSIRIFKILFVFTTFIFVYLNGTNYLIGTYSQAYLESKAGTMALYSEILFIIIFMSIITLHCRNSYIQRISSLWQYAKQLGLLFHLCLLTYLVLVMISGDRGPIMIIGMSYFFSYIMAAKKRVLFVHVVVLVIGAAIIFSALGYARNIDKSISFVDRFSIALQGMATKAEIKRESVFPITSELSGSAKTLHYAMNYVPEIHPYLYGSIQFREVLAMIPFSSYVTNYFLDSDFRYRSSAYFITWLSQGNFYTYGTGTSVVADLYLSFGVLGVLLGLFLFGILLRKLEIYIFYVSIDEMPSFYLITSIFAYGYSIYIARASILSPLNFMIFTVIVVYSYQKMIKRYGKQIKDNTCATPV